MASSRRPGRGKSTANRIGGHLYGVPYRVRAKGWGAYRKYLSRYFYGVGAGVGDRAARAY